MYLLNSNDPLDKSPDSHDGDSMRRRFKPRAASTQTPPRASLESSLPKCGSSSYTSSSRPAKRKTLPRPRRGQATYYGLSSAHGGVLRRSWAPPLALILVFICAYALDPSDANIVSHFLFLSYRLDSHQQHQQHDGGGGRSSSFSSSTPQYGKGPWDLAFVCFYTVVLSFAREFVTQEVLRPAARACGIRSRAKQSRFMEQMYTACYVAVVAGPLGLYVMEQQQQQWHASSTPSALTTTAGPLPTLSFWHGFLGETKAMYESYPHRTHGAVFKCYYLLQAAFWAQQVLVMALGLEKRRSDFREFVAHHVVTVALIWLSYRFHFTHMGVAVYVTHDVSDFFLAVSKSLNYINHPLQSYTFALCIAAWIYLRHYINLIILYSVATEFSTIGPFELDWEAEQYKCRISQVVTFGLLAGLQALNLFWLYCLLRSAYRYIITGVAKDDRSEPEDS